MSKVHIILFDTTLRDGAQSLPASNQFADGAKPNVADFVARLGIGVIEAGFPATPADAADVSAVAKSVGTRSYMAQTWRDGELVGDSEHTPVIAGLSRATPRDIDATWSSIQAAHSPRVHTFISTSDFHREHKFPGVSRQQLLGMGTEAIRYARQLTAPHIGASVEFSAEAATTTDPEYLRKVVESAVRAGVDVVNVPDTVGERDPMWMHAFYTKVLGWAAGVNPDVVVSAHNHNDLGNACANSFMLVRAAAEYASRTDQDVSVQIEATVCGLGERAGNADVFSVMGSVFKFARELAVSVEWQYNPAKSVEVANSVMQAAGLNVNRQQPIVGSDTNVHRSGIHSDGVVKGGYSMYTPFDPTFWGHAEQAVHEDGKYQGRAGKAAAQSRAS